MRLIVDEDLRSIARAIREKTARVGRGGWDWNEDEFQIGCFCGGYCDGGGDGDGPPGFYFSYYAPDGKDYIFRMSFEDVEQVANGGEFSPPLRYWKDSPLGEYSDRDAND